METLRALDRWWFGRSSPVSFGVFRIAMASLAFVNLAMVSIDFDEWFTERGFVPWRLVPIYFGPDYRLNLLFGVTDWRLTLSVYVGTMIAALLTAAGLWTRVSSIALAVGYVSIHHRNPFILHGGDVVLRLGLMYLALGPSGSACSLDRIIGIWKGKAPLRPPDISMWAQRLVQFEVALIYFTTVWHKWKGHYWRDGTAGWYPQHLNEFDRFWLPDFVKENIFLVKASTYGTLLVELSFASLVFYKPLRKYVLWAGVLLHLFIEYSMNIPLFAFVMISTYVCFFDGKEVSEWADRVGTRFARFKVTIRAGLNRAFLPSRARALAAMSPFALVEYVDGGTSPVVGAAGPSAALLRSPGAWIFGLAPLLWRSLLGRAAKPTKSDLDAHSAAEQGARQR